MLVITVAPLIQADESPNPDHITTNEEGEAVAPPPTTSLMTLFDYLCRSFQIDLPAYMQDPYGSHVLRVTMSALAGLPAGDVLACTLLVDNSICRFFAKKQRASIR
jgi:hypothetical protein